MEQIYKYVKKIKKDQYDFFTNDIYGIKKKRLDVEKIKKELSDNQLIML